MASCKVPALVQAFVASPNKERLLSSGKREWAASAARENLEFQFLRFLC